MTQVEVDDQIDVGKSLSRIEGGNEAIRIRSDGKVSFIRGTPEESRYTDGTYQVQTYVPVIDGRRKIADVDGDAVSMAIRNAEAARIVRINHTPFSGAYEGDFGGD